LIQDHATKDILELKLGGFSKKDSTALHRACLLGRADVAKALCDKSKDEGANTLNIADINGYTPLLAAAQNEHLACIRHLIDAGADVNLLHSERDSSPLMAAAEEGFGDCVKYLIEAGAAINYTGKEGTALHKAAWYPRLDCVKLLVDAGAIFNTLDENTYTPLAVAARSYREGSTESVKLMLDAGADVNYVCGDGKTALWGATRENVKVLVGAGADVNFQH